MHIHKIVLISRLSVRRAGFAAVARIANNMAATPRPITHRTGDKAAIRTRMARRRRSCARADVPAATRVDPTAAIVSACMRRSASSRRRRRRAPMVLANASKRWRRPHKRSSGLPSVALLCVVCEMEYFRKSGALKFSDDVDTYF